MAIAVAGGEKAFKQRPMIIINMLAVSPLQWSRENLGAILALTKMGCPMIIGSEPQGGTTGSVASGRAGDAERGRDPCRDYAGSAPETQYSDHVGKCGIDQ